MDFAHTASGADGFSDEFAVGDTAFEGVGEFDAEALAVSEVAFDFVGEMADVGHDLGAAVVSQ